MTSKSKGQHLGFDCLLFSYLEIFRKVIRKCKKEMLVIKKSRCLSYNILFHFILFWWMISFDFLFVKTSRFSRGACSTKLFPISAKCWSGVDTIITLSLINAYFFLAFSLWICNLQLNASCIMLPHSNLSATIGFFRSLRIDSKSFRSIFWNLLKKVWFGKKSGKKFAQNVFEIDYQDFVHDLI